MQNQPAAKLPRVEQDTRMFMGFMTLVIVSMYTVTLINDPASRQPIRLIPLTILVLIHIILHWMLERFSTNPTRTLWYMIIQGILALIISWLAGNIGMSSGLFMAMLGEAVGLFGMTRQSLIAGIYFLTLFAASILQIPAGFSQLWFLASTIPMAGFVVIYVTLYMRQNNAREQAEQLANELEIANRQLTEYAARVEDLTIANERQRMARELHDTLSQGLAGIILQLEAVEAHLASQRAEKAQAIITNAKSQARATLADARAAIDDLRQDPPDDLDSALRLEISRFTDATGIPCAYRAEQTALIPHPVMETIIRAASEALTNIARHARASQASLTLTVANGAIHLEITDNGIGFDPASIPSGHYGLLGIRERLRIHNGQLNINAIPQTGTTLTIEIPPHLT